MHRSRNKKHVGFIRCWINASMQLKLWIKYLQNWQPQGHKRNKHKQEYVSGFKHLRETQTWQNSVGLQSQQNSRGEEWDLQAQRATLFPQSCPSTLKQRVRNPQLLLMLYLQWGLIESPCVAVRRDTQFSFQLSEITYKLQSNYKQSIWWVRAWCWALVQPRHFGHVLPCLQLLGIQQH